MSNSRKMKVVLMSLLSLVLVVMPLVPVMTANAQSTMNMEVQVTEESDSGYTSVEEAQQIIDQKSEEMDALNQEIEEVNLYLTKEQVPFYATFWALIPPIVAIGLALITKEVYLSLFVGIVAGALLYANFNPIKTIENIFDAGIIANLSNSGHVGILIFLVVLGIMVNLMNKVGGSAAYGQWASTKIRSRKGAMAATFGLGAAIFVDDYFNCLTVGSVMRPVTDKFKVSRAKLAYIIDSTAAPICIIAPISSWAAAVTGIAEGQDGFSLFIKAIPYNFYAILTIVMVVGMIILKFDFGPMEKHEENAINGDLYTTDARPYADVENQEVAGKGKVIDLILPVVMLVACCVVGLLYTGGFFDGTSFIDAFANSDASLGLAYGSFIALVLTFLLYIPRKVITLKGFTEAIPEGFKSMVPAILILVFAWTLSGMTRLLGADVFVHDLVEGAAGSLQLFLPAVIFLISIGLAFATGTSWGTFSILLPIVFAILEPGSEMLIIAVSACLAGAVCGDHISPISDTTIMASTGAQCDHINHVTTQLPYALICAGVSFVCYIIAAFVQNWLIALPISIALMIITIVCIDKFCKSSKVLEYKITDTEKK
ncbi:MAG: Na+/H+ antiporter NhaC family protein [Clostridiales bacterium]|nr:Na+/H+ antiporter NhaC family protein [Clostridiales bacterium]